MRYYLVVKKRRHFEEQLRERNIPEEICEKILANPLESAVQEDGTIAYWGYFEERDLYVKVVVSSVDGAGITVHPDRAYKKKIKRSKHES